MKHIRYAFPDDVSCSWYEFNLHDNASIYVVYVESYYDGKNYITENKTFIDNPILRNQSYKKFL